MTPESRAISVAWLYLSREKCCCPTFIIAVAGPWLCVIGGVFTGKVVVQRLTDLRWLGLSSTQEEAWVINIARMFVALRDCLRILEGFYHDLRSADIPALVARVPHPRFFPYPTSYTKTDGSLVTFRYIKSMEQDQSTCVTFLAKIVSEDDPKKVVIKFVERYGEDVQQYLADKGKAPKLYYIGHLNGLRHTTGSSITRMVVMEYIDSKTTAPLDVHTQIKEILTNLHSEGYVFGDLRRPNILVNRMNKIFLIDFNWCGRYKSIMHDGIPKEIQQRIDEKFARKDTSIKNMRDTRWQCLR